MTAPFILILIDSDDPDGIVTTSAVITQPIASETALQRAETVRTAHRLYRARRRREKNLADVLDLFHDPAWDMLLDLYIRGETGRMTYVTDACIASGVAPTTALRMLWELAKREALTIEKDPDDRRRKFVSLAPATRSALYQWLVSFGVS